MWFCCRPKVEWLTQMVAQLVRTFTWIPIVLCGWGPISRIKPKDPHMIVDQIMWTHFIVCQHLRFLNLSYSPHFVQHASAPQWPNLTLRRLMRWRRWGSKSGTQHRWDCKPRKLDNLVYLRINFLGWLINETYLPGAILPNILNMIEYVWAGFVIVPITRNPHCSTLCPRVI